MNENAIDEEDGPPSPDSEFDDELALSDVDISSPCNTRRNGHLSSEEDLPSSRPYSVILRAPVKFKSPQREVFIPGAAIELHITDFERNFTTHLLNPNLYTINLKHGDFQWTIHRRYKHIQHLHQQLRIFRATLNIPIPTKAHRERRSSFKNELNRTKGKNKRNLPRFPSKPDALVPYEKVDLRMKLLERYLQNLLKINLYRSHHETATFLEVSELSFVGSLGFKGKEGMVLKRTRSSHPGRTGCNFCGVFDSGLCVRCNYVCSDLCGSWRTRWLVVKESFVAYIRPKDGRVKAVILFDSGFEVSSGIISTGYRNSLRIVNHSRQIILKCPTRRETQEWLNFIKETLQKEGREFTQRNRYDSFTPQRSLVLAAWFVDGCGYMSAVADALEMAQEEIYIADWWLSPEIHLKRPSQTDYWRLDKILSRKACEGVKIFVLLYKEVELALGINSFYSKQTIIGNQSENIKVLRHPDHAKAGVFLWAHHEKLVIVDQNIAFIGGIDLCYGRWDDLNHRLVDLGYEPTQTSEVKSSIVSHATVTLSAPVMGGSNLSLKEKRYSDNGSTGKYSDYCEEYMLQPSAENAKCDTPELERKNILSSVRTRGKELMHMLSLSLDDYVDGEIDIKTPENEGTSMITEEVCLTSDESCDEIERHSVSEKNISSKLWIGKDYTNFIVKDFSNLHQPFQDLVNRNITPRMPWHDVGMMVQGSAARDLARHFIQRWNAVKMEKAKLNSQYPYLIPKAYKVSNEDFQIPKLSKIRVSCQVVRSVSHWSAGFLDADTWEGSIHEAYVDAISKAKHFIYIENQFFISSLPTSQVKNQVADALYKRILRAHKQGDSFRVYIVLPLLPGFEGEVGTSSGTALHAITHWNYASISRGNESLLVRLKAAGIPDPSEYITFHGLRKHSVLNGEPITELIYVHSKLMIADDRLAICGSANINDRSLIGKRDSEIAVVIQDEEFSSGIMNGESYETGKFCGALRKYLFKEHLGLLGASGCEIDITDPVCSQFYHKEWRLTSQNNTDIFEKVFHCIPSDQATNFLTMKKYVQDPLSRHDPLSAKALLAGVKGHLVMFPLSFLCDETLTPTASSVQGLMPTSLWT